MTASAAVRVDPSALVRAQVAIDTHTIAADGSWVAYVRRTVVGGEYRRHLWRIGVDGGSPRRLTTGRVVDTCPAISPDRRRIAFLRATADTRAPKRDRDAQAWVMPSTDGEGAPIGRMPHGVTGLLWSPDSRTLALLAPAAESRFTVGRVTDGVEPIARRLTRLDFRRHRLPGQPRPPVAGPRPTRCEAAAADVRRLRRPITGLVAGWRHDRLRHRPRARRWAHPADRAVRHPRRGRQASPRRRVAWRPPGAGLVA